MGKPRMVVTDLDGTLLRDNKTLSEATLQVLRRLRRERILFVVATARPIRAVDGMIPSLRYDAGIFHNGAVITERGRRVAGWGIEKPDDLIRGILADRADCHVAVEVDDRLYANFDVDRIWRGIPYLPTSDFREMRAMTADKIIIETDTLEKMAGYRPYLPESLYLELSEHTIAMIMHRQATKRQAVRLLAERHGFGMEEVIAFGDDYNDIDMLRGCGCGVAVGNALEVVKEAADEVCETNENDGVARWLAERLDL